MKFSRPYVCGIATSSILLFASAGCGSSQQSNAQFKAAIDNRSSSPSFVMIQVTDERTKQVKSGCTSAPHLLGAIHLEKGLGYDPASMDIVKRMALSAASHEFTFRSKAALQNIGFDGLGTRYAEACRLIEQGKQAIQEDDTRQIKEQ